MTDKQVAIIGGGVIGGGWATRFALVKQRVNLYDPDPEAERKVNEVLQNARASLPLLADTPLRRRPAGEMCAFGRGGA